MTYCIAIHSEMKTSQCPLDSGHCYWQHAQTKQCMFTTDELTVPQFCERVGLRDVPTQEQIDSFVSNLKTELRA